MKKLLLLCFILLPFKVLAGAEDYYLTGTLQECKQAMVKSVKKYSGEACRISYEKCSVICGQHFRKDEDIDTCEMACNGGRSECMLGILFFDIKLSDFLDY